MPSARSKTLGGSIVVLAMLSLAACAPSGAGDEKPARMASPEASRSAAPSTAGDAAQPTTAPVTAAPLPTALGEIGETIAFDTGVSVSIDSVTPVEIEAKTPGEVSGSAVVVKVTAVNDSAEVRSVDSAVVRLTADDGEIGIGTSAGDPAPLHGDIAAGKKATGRYVFMLGSAADRAITVSVNYAAGAPVAVFTGKAS